MEMGGTYVALVREPSPPSAPSLCPWLIYFPDHVFPAQSEFIFPFTLTLEVNLRPCFLAEEKKHVSHLKTFAHHPQL